MKLLVQNTKIKNSGKGSNALVYNFGIPAFKSIGGDLTCPMARQCVTGCYARSGAYLFSNVNQAYEKRYQLTLTEEFSTLVSTELRKIVESKKAFGKEIFIRIHDSGDFYSKAYFEKWRTVMLEFPEVTFYAYTKMVSQFQAIKDLPDNFKLIFSFGGKQDHLINKATERHSVVFKDVKALRAAKYTDCSHDDLRALQGLKVGLVFHHAKNWDNTAWNKVKA